MADPVEAAAGRFIGEEPVGSSAGAATSSSALTDFDFAEAFAAPFSFGTPFTPFSFGAALALLLLFALAALSRSDSEVLGKVSSVQMAG